MSDLLARIAEARTINELWRLVPRVECKRLCGRSCGVIMASQWEVDRVVKFVRESRPRPCTGPDGITCGYLDGENVCSVHPVRPLVCRMFGAAEGLMCEHGCESDPLTLEEGMTLLMRAEQIGGGESAFDPETVAAVKLASSLGMIRR